LNYLLKRVKSIIITLDFFQNIFFEFKVSFEFFYSQKCQLNKHKNNILLNQKRKNYLSDTKSENMIINQKHNTVQLIVDKHG
jgi:hypothetical protein